MAQAPPKAGTKDLLYSLNLIHEFTSLFSPKVTFAGSLRKAFSQKHISVFLWLRKQRPRFAQGQPTGYFRLKKLDIKNLIEPRKLLSQWMTGWDSWMTPCTNMCPYVPACANIAVWQLCTETQPLRNSDVLPTWFMQVCLGKPSHKNRQRWTLDISVFLWLRKIRPRPAQGLFPIERTSYNNYKVYSQMNADWKVDKAQYAEFNVPRCGKIAVCQLCRQRQPLWYSHDSWWPELKMFGSMPLCSFPWQKVLPGGKELLYTLSLIYDFVSRRWWIQVCLGKPSHGIRPL